MNEWTYDDLPRVKVIVNAIKLIARKGPNGIPTFPIIQRHLRNKANFNPDEIRRVLNDLEELQKKSPSGSRTIHPNPVVRLLENTARGLHVGKAIRESKQTERQTDTEIIGAARAAIADPLKPENWAMVRTLIRAVYEPRTVTHGIQRIRQLMAANHITKEDVERMKSVREHTISEKKRLARKGHEEFLHETPSRTRSNAAMIASDVKPETKEKLIRHVHLLTANPNHDMRKERYVLRSLSGATIYTGSRNPEIVFLRDWLDAHPGVKERLRRALSKRTVRRQSELKSGQIVSRLLKPTDLDRKQRIERAKRALRERLTKRPTH